jgi:hypothetical protein
MTPIVRKLGQVTEVGRPDPQQLVTERLGVLSAGDVDLDDQQRDRDREDAVAEASSRAVWLVMPESSPLRRTASAFV